MTQENGHEFTATATSSGMMEMTQENGHEFTATATSSGMMVQQVDVVYSARSRSPGGQGEGLRARPRVENTLQLQGAQRR